MSDVIENPPDAPVAEVQAPEETAPASEAGHRAIRTLVSANGNGWSLGAETAQTPRPAVGRQLLSQPSGLTTGGGGGFIDKRK